MLLSEAPCARSPSTPSLIACLSRRFCQHSRSALVSNAGSGTPLANAARTSRRWRRTTLADPVNLFLPVAVGQDGRLTPGTPRSPPGAGVTFRVLIDADVIVAACATDLGLPEARGPIRVRVANEL